MSREAESVGSEVGLNNGRRKTPRKDCGDPEESLERSRKVDHGGSEVG